MDQQQQQQQQNKVFPGIAQPNNPSTVVIVNQEEQNVDYTVKGATCPGAFVIVIGLLNLVAFIVLGAMLSSWTGEFIAAFILYFILGVLATVGGSRKQDNKGVAVATLIFAIFCLFLSFVQIITRGLGVAIGQVVQLIGLQDLGNIVFYTNIVLLAFAFIGLALSITLIVLPSKVLCCRKPNNTVIIHNTGNGPQGNTQVMQY